MWVKYFSLGGGTQFLLALLLVFVIFSGCGRQDQPQSGFGHVEKLEALSPDRPAKWPSGVQVGNEPSPVLSHAVADPSSLPKRESLQGDSDLTDEGQPLSSESASGSLAAKRGGDLTGATSPQGVTRVERPVRPNPLRDGSGLLPEKVGLREGREPQTGFEVAELPRRPGKGKGAPFDPIKENGPIFVGWPPPKFVLVLTGREDGYLEPCGCAGLDRMKGGLARRHAMFAQLREAWNCPVLGLDVGGLIKGFGRQAELKFHLIIQAMRQMGYRAIAFGVPELRLPAGELLAASVEEADGALFISANVALFGFDQGFTPGYKVVDLPGGKLGVTAVLGDMWQRQLHNPDVQTAPAEEKLQKIVPLLEKEANLLVLLAHASREESWRLGELFPQFDIVVTAGTPPEPPAEPARFKDGRLFIEVGTKGMNAIVLGFYDSGEKIRYQRVPLDSRFPQAKEVLVLLAEYQQQLKDLGLEGLGLRPAPNPKLVEMGQYVGSRKCRSCHELSYEVWRKSGHAKAWRTLEELEIPRVHDPECISCHVTGWHPTEYFPYEGGFWSVEKTPHLVDVGCEACHGPGEKHIQAEMGSDFDAQEKYRRLVRVTLEESRDWQCVSCHDLDNSPDFDFDTYWPFVAHYEE